MHYCNILQNRFTVLRTPFVLLVYPFPPQILTVTDLFIASIVLVFQNVKELELYAGKMYKHKK